MRLPPRPTTDSTTAPLVDAVMWELYELQQIHQLTEQGAAHDTNRQAAQRAYTEAMTLLSHTPENLEQWATRARYVAHIFIDEITQEAAA